MNNIIRSQRFILKHRIVSVSVAFLSAILVIICGISLNPDTAQCFAQPGFMAMFIFLFIPVLVICYSYGAGIQKYEIMAGFRPHQIIWGRAITFLPVLLLFLAATAVIFMLHDSSAQTVTLLLLYYVLCIRGMLCIVFLSPLLNVGSFLPLFSVILLMINGSDMDALSRSPISFFCFAQCTLLVREITEGFVIKVIVTSVISCVVYYLIGYYTLKTKLDNEPLPLS